MMAREEGGAVNRAGERDARSAGMAAAKADRPWLPLNALRAFEAVAQRLSFTAAAGALHVSQSALSRHVSRLEDRLGQRLLERNHGGLELTAAGETLLPAVSRAFNLLEGTLAGLQKGGSAGPRALAIHMPPTFLQVVGLSLLRDFRAAHPDILLDVTSHNGVGAPSARGLDVVVTFDRPQVDTTVRDLLWMVRQVPACAPAVAARAAGRSFAEFVAGEQLLHVKLEGEPVEALWASYARQAGLPLDARRGLAFDTEALSAQCALAGEGVALIDPRLFSRELADGRLVTPHDVTVESGFGYFLTFQPEDIADPVIAFFRRWVLERFASDQTGAP